MTDMTGSTDSTSYRMERLNSQNYYLWSKKIELILRGKGLWGLVSGDERPPVADDTDEQLGFQRRKDIALSNILLTIEDSSSATVLHLRDPKAVWDELKKIYQAISEAAVDSLLEKYQRMKMKVNEIVSQYVNRLVQVENKLASIGRPVPKDERKRAMLCSLSADYKVIAQVIRAMNISITEAIGMLITHEMTLRGEEIVEESDDISTALAALHPKDRKYLHGGRKGHEKKDCFHNPESDKYRQKGRGYSQNREGRRQKSSKRRETDRAPRRNFDGASGHQNGDKSGDTYVTFMTRRCSPNEMRVSGIRDKWFNDSGATSHMSNKKVLFSALSKQESIRSVSVGNGNEAEVVGVGTVRCVTTVGSRHRKVCLEKTLYIPDLMCNLLSVSRMRQAGLRVVFESNSQMKGICSVRKPETNETVLQGFERQHGLYEVSLERETFSTQTCNVLMSSTDISQSWHARLGHASKRVIDKTISIVDGIDIKSMKPGNCDSCLKGKSTRDKRPSVVHRQTSQPLQLVHADIIGPVQTPSLNGSKYCIPLYDDFSGISILQFTETKRAAAEGLQDMILELETTFQAKNDSKKVTTLRTDNAKEFLSNAFATWLKSKGIRQELSSPYSPESNGKAERLNRTLMDIARTLLVSISHIQGYERLWAEAMRTANYLRNRMYSSACSVNGKTPLEVILDRRPNFSHIRRFGAVAYVHIPKEKRKEKFQARAKVGVLVGFERGNSYKVWFPQKHQIVTSRDVTFDELAKSEPANAENHKITSQSTDFKLEVDTKSENSRQSPHETGNVPYGTQESSVSPVVTPPDRDDLITQELVTHYPTQTRSGRIIKQTQRYSSISGIALSVRYGNEDATTPTTYKEAMESPNKQEWRKAMQEEIDQLNANHSWILEPLPDSAKPVKNRWVYAIKKDACENITRHRARLVAKGYTQQRGIEYGETYAPVAKYSTLRLLLLVAGSNELELLQLDLKAAFLNGKLDEVIYMTQPEGFVDASHVNWVYRLQKALYGLKQAARAWHSVIDTLLRSLGFRRAESDPSLYIRRDTNGIMYILVSVDDMLLCGRFKNQLATIANKIGAEVEIRLEKDVSKFLGILITRNRKLRTLQISSTYMIDEILENFGMVNAHEQNVPIPPGTAVDLPYLLRDCNEGENSQMKFVPYRELIGTLLHLANTTRPDIAYSVSLLSRFIQDPRRTHWQAAKDILRYLKGTRTTGITYKKQLERAPDIYGYTDSDFAADRIERKSTSGFVFISAGGAVSWKSKKQDVVAQSTVEAEYIAMSFAVREALWLQRINTEFSDSHKKPMEILLHADNQGAMEIARNDMCNERSKHIDVKFHFLREHVRNGAVKLQYVSTNNMVADIMTKA